MKVAFYTLGCKVNQYETEAMREAFIKAGHTSVTEDAPFDAVVINSCTVTAESDRKTRQTVRRFRRERPDAIIILTGCMVQAFSSEAQALSEADIVAGNTDVEKIVSYAEKFALDGERIFSVSPHGKKERFNTPTLTDFAERTRAYMKIEDGCERFCTYCIIPTARGFVRSKPVEEIKAEAEKLADAGFSEIVLVGINLTSYGKGEEINLCDAVSAVCSVDGIKRVRLGSLEPDHMSDEMLKRLSGEEKFCPQFHLSLKSGCDETLKRMNRHYDTDFYRDLVLRIRKIFKNAAITTDVMVGFAAETVAAAYTVNDMYTVLLAEIIILAVVKHCRPIVIVSGDRTSQRYRDMGEAETLAKLFRNILVALVIYLALGYIRICGFNAEYIRGVLFIGDANINILHKLAHYLAGFFHCPKLFAVVKVTAYLNAVFFCRL